MLTQIDDYIGAIFQESGYWNHKKEVCGIVSDGKFIVTQNVADNPRDDFQINAAEIGAYFGKIDFIWHTHCSSSHPDLLTPSDIALSRKIQAPILMVHIVTNAVDYYEPNNFNPFPLSRCVSHQVLIPNVKVGARNIKFYEGWQSNDLLWGRSDCFETVRCYFLGMHGIEIGNFDRPPLQGFPAPDWRTPWIAEKHGFVVVDDIRDNDILEIALNGGENANHLAVVVDAQRGLILHQPGFGHLSQVSRLGGYWRDRLAVGEDRRQRVLRHSSFC